MLSVQEKLLNRPFVRYVFAVVMAAAGFLVRQALTAFGAAGLPTYITFYPAIMITAMAAGLWPGIVATVTVALITDYWILPPEGFGISSFTDIVGVVFFSGMGVFMSLVAEFYRRAREKAQKSSLELKAANEALHDLSSKILSAHEDERKRIASDIHDTLGSCLAAIKFKMDRAQGEEDRPQTVQRSA